MDSNTTKFLKRLAEGNINQKDTIRLENQMKEVIRHVWNEELITDDMDTEQIWYQIEEILGPIAATYVAKNEQSEEEEMNLENEDYESDEENNNSLNEVSDKEPNDYEELDEEQDEYNAMEEENDDYNLMEEEDLNEEEASDKNQKEESQKQDLVNGDDNDSYNEYEFDDEEYNKYLEDMDEEDLNQENNENDEELEFGEEDESEYDQQEIDKNNENDENNEHDQEDPEDAEDLLRTLAYGTTDKNIEQIENKLIEKKGWQLRGEIRAQDREKNALLEEDLEFQRGIQTKAKISKEVNENYEAIIKQRILDLAFDDRSSSTYFNKPVVNEQVKDLPEIDFEKDKRGLIGVYEDQYKKSVMGLDEKKSKDDKIKDQIKDLYRLICFSIDNMTRFQYNPNVVSLADKKTADGFIIDEKIPIVVSGDLLKDRKRYKDVYDPKDKELKSKAEMTKEEKLRLRRKIKRTMKVKKERLKQKEIERTGMRGSDYKILEKNQSKIKKQIMDSKVKPAAKYTKKSEFFSTINKNAI